ncbi:T9SS type A sorting domain-containing protein [Capnocytophaga canimorsus]|uniref:T9SS type A sorting domain-containing protein n=1 Tax=Capnocytophaga canimorsus TaxID=28188 RepID=UPI001EDDDDA3|nr:T9SS type A sorting domain-containing protein [Capnocytophaga canimorsus]GJQ05085.1 hypothetical protein CAPN009_15000 [Capnocytophaga canimorsus]
MKRTILVLSLLFSFTDKKCFAQDISQQISLRDKEINAYYVRASHGFWATGGGRHLCELWTNVYVNNRLLNRTSGENNFNKTAYDFYKEKPINIRYTGKAQREIDYIFYTTCGGDEEGIERTDPIELCKRLYYHVNGDNHGTSLTYSLEAYAIPLHTFSSEKLRDTISNSYLPIGTKVKLLAKEGFPLELYNYQYSKTRTWNNAINDYEYQWENLSQASKSHILSVSAEDIFGSKLEAERHIGEMVYFRVVSFDKDNFGQVCSSSNVIPLKVTISAPKVKEFKPVQPRCPKENGSVQVVLDRELYANEKARLSIVQGTMVNGTFSSTGDPVISYDNEQFKANFKNKTITIPNIASLRDSLHWYQLQFIGKYYYERDSISSFSDGVEFNKTFRIVAIPELKAEITSKNNVCYGESEGSIEVSVSGGTPPYRYIKDGDTLNITGNKFTLTDLSARDYTIGILDSHNCRREDTTITITEPVAPITIVNEKEEEEKSNEEPNPSFFKKDVSGFGLKNGEIQAILTGGTPFEAPSEPYRYTLTTKSGVVVSTFSTQTNVQGFTVRYSQLDKGDYILTITDKNNCVLTKTIFIDEPDPLVVSISEKNAISCNPANEDPNNDPKLNKDGELYAYVKGGRPPYEYQWYRVEAGNSERLLGETGSVLKQLTEGVYRVDIKDKKNNTTSGSFTLKFPERLILTTESTEIRCSAPTSGTAKALPQGGTPPYTYQWSDGQTSQTATGLSVGKYFVVVSDSKGCSVQSQVVLSYPEAARIDSEEITQLTCYGDDNGSIVLTTSGGKGTVTHTWYDASGRMLTKGVSKDGKSVKNLVAGTYKIVLRDEGDCPPIEKIFEITQPEKLQLHLPTEVTLCQGDSHTFELGGQIADATYRWTDASGNLLGTDASLVVHLAGDYYVEATSPEGCKASAKTIVKQSSQILEVDFLVATTSYYDYTLKLINLSKKADALQWQFPDDVIVINQNRQEAEVRFPKEGIYRVGLKGTLGECQKVIEKQLFVEKDRVGISQGIQVQKNIESFLIVPNPNSGSYQLHIKLNKASTIRVRLIDMLGRELFAPEEFSEQTDFILPFNKPTLSAGQYIILIEAAGDVLSQKMIVK